MESDTTNSSTFPFRYCPNIKSRKNVGAKKWKKETKALGERTSVENVAVRWNSRRRGRNRETKEKLISWQSSQFASVSTKWLVRGERASLENKGKKCKRRKDSNWGSRSLGKDIRASSFRLQASCFCIAVLLENIEGNLRNSWNLRVCG